MLESPDTFIVLPIMSALGACLGRSIWFDQDFVKIYPMMNLLLIGESGLGKSTCLGLAWNFIRSLAPEKQPNIIGPNTKEGLHKELMAAPRAVLQASELANFFNKAKYMEPMIPYITELLDYAPYVECGTKGGGTSRVMEPSVTIAGGSTLEWLQDELPDTAGSGGFLPRFFIVVEEKKRQKVALPGLMLSKKGAEELARKREQAKIVFSQLVSQVPTGPIKMHDYGVAERFVLWYESQKSVIGHLTPFIARSRETVLRLSILLAVSCGNVVILEEHIEGAIALYELATKKLATVAVPATQEGKLLMQILKVLGDGSKSERELFRALETVAPAQRLQVLIDSHLKSGAIYRRDDGKLQRKSNM